MTIAFFFFLIKCCWETEAAHINETQKRDTETGHRNAHRTVTLKWHTEMAHINGTQKCQTELAHRNSTLKWHTEVAHRRGTQNWHTERHAEMSFMCANSLYTRIHYIRDRLMATQHYQWLCLWSSVCRF